MSEFTGDRKVLREPAIILGLFLGASTIAVFWPVVRCGLVALDDPVYVSENHHVLNGLSLENLRWAFSNTSEGFWQPLV
jgi:hypothetical protein